MGLGADSLESGGESGGLCVRGCGVCLVVALVLVLGGR